MPKVKIIHCADAHIGAREDFLGTKADSRRNETLLTFEKAVNLAKEQGVQFFLIAGDLFDSFKTEKIFINEVLNAIASASGTEFIYSAGNHDPYSINSPLRNETLPNNFHILDTEDCCITFDEYKTRIYGRSFKDVYENGESNFSIIPPDDDFINIMCIHGELSTDKSSHYNPISQEFIRTSGMDYIALGHTHSFDGISKEGSVFYAYSGCIEGQGFDEIGEKGVLIGEISKGKADLSFYPISYRLHIVETVDITGCDNGVSAAEKIISQLKANYGENHCNNLYKIILKGTVKENCISSSEITSRLSDYLYYVKIKDNTAPDLDLELISNEPSLKGLFVKKMLEKIEKEENDDEKKLLYDALFLGLKAFSSEVSFIED